MTWKYISRKNSDNVSDKIQKKFVSFVASVWGESFQIFENSGSSCISRWCLQDCRLLYAVFCSAAVVSKYLHPRWHIFIYFLTPESRLILTYFCVTERARKIFMKHLGGVITRDLVADRRERILKLRISARRKDSRQTIHFFIIPSRVLCYFIH